jgi:hypothetical protein
VPSRRRVRPGGAAFVVAVAAMVVAAGATAVGWAGLESAAALLALVALVVGGVLVLVAERPHDPPGPASPGPDHTAGTDRSDAARALTDLPGADLSGADRDAAHRAGPGGPGGSGPAGPRPVRW